MSDQTRRSWMVTISQAAAGASLALNLPADLSSAQPLPPGVYGPSSDHLSHALMSAEQFHPIPPGCPTDYVLPRNGPFQPQFFTTSEFQVISRLIALLLGENSPRLSPEVAEWIDLRVASAAAIHRASQHLQPLHRSLAVAYYGSAEFAEIDNSDPAAICRQGLASLSTDFLSLDITKQVALLDTISDDRAGERLPTPGTRFFDYLKAETIRGFYTSKAGLKELDFKGNAFYARSPGCESKTNL